MFIQSFPCEPLLTNAYVVACAKTHEAAVIDPAPHSFAKIQNYLASYDLSLKKVLLTHSHWDHIGDVKQFQDNYGVPVYVHPFDAPNLEHPGVDQVPSLLEIPGVKPDVLIEEGDQIPVGELTFHVIHTPGHSAGCVCFYEPEQHVLLSGDTLFRGCIGKICFPTSLPGIMWSSLKKLEQLPPETRIFPGHGPSTTLQAESSWLHDAEKLFGK